MFICCHLWSSDLFCSLRGTVQKLNCVKRSESVKVHQRPKIGFAETRELKLVWIDFLPPFQKLFSHICKSPLAIYVMLCVMTVTWLCQRMAKVNNVTYFLFFLIGKKLPFFSHWQSLSVCVALQTPFCENFTSFPLIKLVDFRPPWTLNFSFPAFPVRCSKSSYLLSSIINLYISFGSFINYCRNIVFFFKYYNKQDDTAVLSYFV